MTANADHRRVIDLLGVRLGLVLGLALLPIGLIAGIQSADLIAKANSQSESVLMGETLRAVRPQIAAIQRAQGAALTLAAVQKALVDGCAPFLRQIVTQGGFASAGLYDVAGVARCTSSEDRSSLNPFPALSRAVIEGRSAISAITGAEGGQLVVIEPTLDAGGAVTGLALVALPGWAPPKIAGSDFSLVMFGAGGEPLGLADHRALLPTDTSLADLAQQVSGQTSFSAPARSGEMRSFAVIELVPDELFALGSRPQEKIGFSLLRSLPPLIVPALMWAVSLVAAWLAAEKLVTRHIRRLRRAILDFAGGSRIVRPLSMEGAPQEIRDTAEAFARMTTTILRDEAELEDALHGKKVLLREVHHRVKNNLQLIASIVNMQIRRTKSDEARWMMRSLQERMLSLATIHNGLFQTADVSEIRLDQLFQGIVASLVQGAAAQGRNVRLQQHFDPIMLSFDRAIPLALLMTEALSNALRYARNDTSELPAVAVRVVEDGDSTALLEITNDAVGAAGLGLDAGEPAGIGSQLLRGFARQMGGQLDRELTDGRYRVTLRFKTLETVAV